VRARMALLGARPKPLLRELEELAVARAERLVAQRLERLLEVHPRLVEDAALLVEALACLVEPRVGVRALTALGRDLAAHAVELGGALAELTPELVAAGFQLGDPHVAGAPLVVAARGEVRGGRHPRDPRPDEQRDHDERRSKHGRPSPASGA